MSNLVVKDNDLVNASYSLNLVEQRLLLLAILEIRKSKDLLTSDIVIHADSYTEHFGTKKDTAYKSLKDACKDLMARQFSYQQIINDKLVNKTSRWVSEVGYATNGAFVTVKFAPAVIPLITALEIRFTSYPIDDVASLSSGYAVRLFELCMVWRGTGVIAPIELIDLKARLGVIHGEYERMHHFKARVLDLAVSQINEQHKEMNLKYQQHKTGRAITAISFTFKPKKAAKQITNDDAFIKMTDSQVRTFSSKLAALPELGSNAPLGKSEAEFAALIADDLKDAGKQKKYIKHLAKVGYQVSKAKS